MTTRDTDLPPARARRIPWRIATVDDLRRETPRARRIVLEVPDWPGNLGGQHLDVRLTAEDGYQATRSYSIASVGDSPRVELVVDRLPDGEVSPFLNDVLQVGDRLEVRGPLGGWFVWSPPDDHDNIHPVQLIAGGSGVVPMLSILRAHVAAGDPTPMRLMYSVQTPEDVFYREELQGAVGSGVRLEIAYVYTRRAATDGPAAGRLTRDRLAAATIPADQQPNIYVCGRTSFVETVIDWLLELGHHPRVVRAERYGGN